MQKNTLIVVENQNKEILILKRNPKEKWYPQKWCIVAEKIKKGETPDDCFKRGLFEETKIKNYKKVLKGKPYIFKDGNFKRKIYPYLCRVEDVVIILNREHSEYKWVKIKDLKKFDIASPAKKQINIFYNKEYA